MSGRRSMLSDVIFDEVRPISALKMLGSIKLVVLALALINTTYLSN